MRKNFLNEMTTLALRQLLPRLPSHFILVVDGEHRAQVEPTGLDGIRCPFLAHFNRVSPVRDTNTRWPSTDSIVPPQPTDRSVYHQRITSQAMFSLPSVPIHSKRLVLRRSANGFRFSSTSITSNSPITSPSNRTIIFLPVCCHTLKVYVSRLTVASCSGGGRQTGRPERR